MDRHAPVRQVERSVARSVAAGSRSVPVPAVGMQREGSASKPRLFLIDVARGIAARRMSTTGPRCRYGIGDLFSFGSSGISGEGRSRQEEGPAIAKVGGHRDTCCVQSEWPRKPRNAPLPPRDYSSFLFDLLSSVHCARLGNPVGCGGGPDRRWVGLGSVRSVVSVAHPGWNGRAENRPLNHLPQFPEEPFSMLWLPDVVASGSRGDSPTLPDDPYCS